MESTSDTEAGTVYLTSEIGEIESGKVRAFKELTEGLFRKLMGAGIVFYSLHFLFGIATKDSVKETVLLMILTFIINLVLVVAGFYYGAAHVSKALKQMQEQKGGE